MEFFFFFVILWKVQNDINNKNLSECCFHSTGLGHQFQSMIPHDEYELCLLKFSTDNFKDKNNNLVFQIDLKIKLT